MTYLMAVSWFVYGGDVSELANPSYIERATAYSRLKEAGVWAVPALWAGRATAKPEGQLRIGILLDRRAAWWWPIIRNALTAKELTPEQVKVVAALVALYPDAADEFFADVDRAKVFWSSNSRVWCQSMPYVNTEKTFAGEIAYMLNAARRQMHEVPMPRAMPHPLCPWEN